MHKILNKPQGNDFEDVDEINQAENRACWHTVVETE